MGRIYAEMNMGEIVEKYPAALEVFKINGFEADTTKALIDQVGSNTMLQTALRLKGFNIPLFIGMLEERITESTLFTEAPEDTTAKKLNFLGYTYCPLKLTFRECFEEVLARYRNATNDTEFRYFVPSGCGGDDAYENIWMAENIDDFPDILVSIGFGDFFRQEFVDRLVKKGYFKAVPYKRLNPCFASAGIEDPDGWYTVYSVFPLVMLIDFKKLGNLPVPRKWSDLLSPVYRNNIITGASCGEIHEDILLYLYKEHGEEALKKFAYNVKDGWHASQMAKAAGASGSEGAAIYVIPWLFARSCPRTDATSIVWPLDGALSTPAYMLVKESKARDFKMFTDFITGSFYGKKSADNYFPVLNPDVNNRLPENATFKWLGWDFIKSHSMENLKEYVVKIFTDSRNKEKGRAREAAL